MILVFIVDQVWMTTGFAGTATASGCGNSGENSANTHRMSIGDIHSYSLLVRRVVYANGCLGYAFKQTDNGRV